jgi:drug/metabolite transporter (DMT)-like permease
LRLSKTQASIALTFAALLWGFSYTLTKISTNAGMPPGLITVVRGFSFTLLLYIAFHKHIHHITKAEIRLGLAGGVINYAVVQFQASGLKYINPSVSAFITSLYVILVPFVVWIVFRRRPQKKIYLAVLICIIGMGILTNGVSEMHMEFGSLIAFLGAVSVAVQITFNAYTATDSDPFNMAFMLGSTLILFSTIYSLIFEHQQYANVDWSRALIPAIVLGITGSFLGQTIQIVSQKYVEPNAAGLIMVSESVFASVISVLIGMEPFTLNLLIGGLLVTIAMMLTQTNIKKNID